MQVLIFDMDGVVVDSVEHWIEVRDRVIRDRLGVDDVDASELVGMNTHDVYDYLAADLDLDCSKEDYVSSVDEHADEIYGERVELLSRIEEVLEAAVRNDVRLGLVSATYRNRVEMVLDRFDLAGYLDVVVAGDDVAGPSKPDPAIYEHAVGRFDTTADQCVAVEDSEHGVAAATSAGLYCVGYAHHPGQPLAAADETVDNADSLVDRLVECCRDGRV